MQDQGLREYLTLPPRYGAPLTGSRGGPASGNAGDALKVGQGALAAEPLGATQVILEQAGGDRLGADGLVGLSCVVSVLFFEVLSASC